MAKRFKWTIRFSVDPSWVADGFELTTKRAKEMLANSIPFAYNDEFAAHVVSKPDRCEIRRVQGYKSKKGSRG